MDQKNNKKALPTSLARLLTNEDDIQRYAEYFYSSAGKAVRDLVLRWAQEQIELSVEKTDSLTRFQESSYSERQAWESGFRQSKKGLIDLIKR